ncbi:MAG: rod shape-determining protein RodA [Alphaproteobacteria bacterium]|nr:rod shape-determining protein RodA [Alphaproteobacteria bacterium]
MRARELDLSLRNEALPLISKLRQLNFGLMLTLTLVACVGFAMLYSAAGGAWEPWAARQMLRFAIGFVIMIAIAVTDIRLWWRLAYAAYALALVLLIGVEIAGEISGGAQRWIDLGPLQIQPSEVMKIALVLTLARYYHGIPFAEVNRIVYLVPPLLLVALPAALVLKQPDLGTAVLIGAGAVAMMFVAGVRVRYFAIAGMGGLGLLPIAWQFLRDYQKKRILTFMDPESDPLGAGYHIMQSKIALGSGGVFGKGFLGGTQGHLNFLPEKQTDFIFTMLAEEFGMVGALVLLGLYLTLLAYGVAIALRCQHHFGRLVAYGVITTLFLYVFINIAMVTGLIPVVGVPLPLVSYGGTAMMTLLIAFGLLMNAHVHRDVRLSRHGTLPEA